MTPPAASRPGFGDWMGVLVIVALIGFWPILVFAVGVWFLLWVARLVIIAACLTAQVVARATRP